VYVNSGHVIAVMSIWKSNLTMDETMSLAFYTTSWNPKQAITLQHLIVYSNLRTYINPKGTIGMPITGRHVWHAYEHDINLIYELIENIVVICS
jgi:hypothetical protein